MKAVNLAYELLSDPERRAAIASAPVSIVTSELPVARAGESYRAPLAVKGGAAPYTWEAVLPAGLELDAAGTLTGRPERTGSFPFTLKLADRDGRTAERVFVLHVKPAPLRVVTQALPNATIGVPYEAELRVEGGVAPLRWSGEPGAGLTLGDGVLFGTPLGPSAVLSLDVRVRDAARQTVTAAYRLVVRPAAAADDASEWSPERLADEQHALSVSAHEADVDVAATRARIALLEARLARRRLDPPRSPPRYSRRRPWGRCCLSSSARWPSCWPGRRSCTRSAPHSSLRRAGRAEQLRPLLAAEAPIALVVNKTTLAPRPRELRSGGPVVTGARTDQRFHGRERSLTGGS